MLLFKNLIEKSMINQWIRARGAFVAKTVCIDPSVNAILAGWRYDISGIFPDMRKDYENHLAECAHCRARQKFHRRLDVTLAVLTSLLVLLSALAMVLLRRFRPMEHVTFTLFGLDVASVYQLLLAAAGVGVCLSVIVFTLVLMSTPVPSHLGGMAAERLKTIEERLPAAIKARRPR
jgi:hypothetical protein